MKITLCGTQCSGKSTLVQELAKLPQFEGYTFETERSKEIRDMGVKLNTDSTLLGQTIFAGYRAKELLQENFISDRSIIDVIAYTNLAESINGEEKRDFNKLYSHLVKEYDYIFYLSPVEVPIESNGVRETNSSYRDAIDMEIRKLMIQNSFRIKNTSIISGTMEERIKQILDFLKL